MFKHLKCIDGTSDKFWEIQTNGTSYTVTYGRNGTSGQSKTKLFETEEDCLKNAEKLILEKTKKGYSEDGTFNPDILKNETVSSKTSSKSDELKEEIIKRVNVIIETGKPEDILPFLNEFAKGNLEVIKKQLRFAKKYWMDFVDLSNDPLYKSKATYNWGTRGTEEQKWMIKLFALATFNASDASSWDNLFDVITKINLPEVSVIFDYAKPQWISAYILQQIRKNEWLSVSYFDLRTIESFGYLTYEPEVYARAINFSLEKSFENIYDLIENDTLFIERDVPLIFDYETNIQNCYLNFDYRSKYNVLIWDKIVDVLLEKNKIEKLFVLSNSLEIQTKNWNTNLKSFFQKLIRRISFREEEIIAHQELFFPLLHSDQSAIVNFTIDYLKPYMTHSEFKMDEFLNWTNGFFMRSDCKGAIKTVLIQLDKQIKKNPTWKDVVLLQIADVFLIQDLPLQERGAKFLLKNQKGFAEELAEKLSLYTPQMLGSISTDLKSLLPENDGTTDDFLEQLGIVSRQIYHFDPKEVKKLNEPFFHPSTWNEILFKIGEAISGDDAIEIEVLMNAWVMHVHEFPSDYKELLEPYINQIKNKYKEGQVIQHFGSVFISYYYDPSKIYVNKDEYSNYSKWASTIGHQLILMQQHLMNRTQLPLLSLPTHKPFWIDPVVLIQRILAYENQQITIDWVDLSIALSRTVRENIENCTDLINQIQSKQLKDIVKYTLGISEDIVLEKKTWFDKLKSITNNEQKEWLGLWANIVRLHHPNQIFSEFESLKDIPFSYQPYRIDLTLSPYYYNEYDYNTKKNTPVYVSGKIDFSFPKVQKMPDTFILGKELFERKEKTYYDYLYKEDFRYMHSLMPHNTEALSLFLNASLNTIADYSGKAPKVYLKEMLFDFFKMDVQSTLFLACSLFGKEKEVRAMALEVLIATIDESRLGVKELGTIIGKLISNTYGPIGRLHEVLSQMRDISSVHHQAILQVLDQTFINFVIPDKMPTNFKKLAELYFDFIHKEEHTVSIEVKNVMEQLMVFKSLQPIVKKIIA